jgi:hypothetical protein
VHFKWDNTCEHLLRKRRCSGLTLVGLGIQDELLLLSGPQTIYTMGMRASIPLGTYEN